jgi:tRNA nucleotidyltransferase (CCA-adding enzyme)
MKSVPDLTAALRDRLPAPVLAFLREAGDAAGHRGETLCLVGGAVRDLLLGRDTLDIDIVLEGDAITLAESLASTRGARLTVHSRFRTANLKLDGFDVDIATARAESYARPGALPAVRPGTIEDDLIRRDFTINTLAVWLNPERFGEVMDRHGGLADLREGVIRVLHERSFWDDPTRIWRAVRYEQRLAFALEPNTMLLLERDLPVLGEVTGTRIRHELELVLREGTPEKTLRRAEQLGLLRPVAQGLKFTVKEAAAFALARERYGTAPQLPLVYLGIMFGGLGQEALEQVVAYLRPTRLMAQVMRETAALKNLDLGPADLGPSPSRVDTALRGYALPSLMAAACTRDAVTAEQIELYLDVLRHVKTALNGKDLLVLGVPEGPRMKEVLDALREARLDGKVTTREEEEDLARKLAAS